MELAVKNTDRELYREPDNGNGSFYSDAVFVTDDGGIGIEAGGFAVVKPIREWVRLAKAHDLPLTESERATRLKIEGTEDIAPYLNQHSVVDLIRIAKKFVPL